MTAWPQPWGIAMGLSNRCGRRSSPEWRGMHPENIHPWLKSSTQVSRLADPTEVHLRLDAACAFARKDLLADNLQAFTAYAQNGATKMTGVQSAAEL